MQDALIYRQEEGVLIVKLPKEIDHHSAKGIRTAIDDKLYSTRPKKLVLDLTDTQFMDSSGLGLVLGRARIAAEMKVEYALANPNRATQKILAMAGADALIPIYSL